MSGVGAVAAARLRARLRSIRFWVLVIVYAVVLLLLLAVTGAVASGVSALANGADAGVLLYSAMVFWVLALAIAVGPAVQGRALNGPLLVGRDAVPHASAAGVVLGAVLAEWVTSLVFVAVALPVLLVVAGIAQVPALMVLTSVLVLLAEVCLLGAIAVGFSGVIRRPGGSVAASYGAMAVLTILTVLVFAVVGNLAAHEVTTQSRGMSWSSTDLVADCDEAYAEGASDCVEDEDGDGVTVCEEWSSATELRPRLDLAWWALIPNPFIVVSDAAPLYVAPDRTGPDDLFGLITTGVRAAQEAGQPTQTLDACTIEGQDEVSTVTGLVARTASTWWLGLLVQALIGAAVLAGAVRREQSRADADAAEPEPAEAAR